MARKTKRSVDYLASCRSRVERARKFREDEGLDDLWDRLRGLYKGKHFPRATTDEDRIAVNMCWSTINVIEPSIAINHPKFTLWATKPELEDASVITEAYLNYTWRHHDCHDEFRLSVKDMLIFGHGWLKTGYRFVEEEIDRDESEIQAEIEEATDQAVQYAEAAPELAHEMPTDEEIAASITTTKMAVAEDRPFVERVSPFDVYVDPVATTVRNMRWIAQRVTRDIDEVRKDERYDERARAKTQPDSFADESSRRKSQNRKPDDDKRVTVWEFYDLAHGQMCVFSEVGEGYLVDPRAMPYRFGHPFVMLRDYEVPDDFYPMGELEAIEDLQGELNKVRSQMMNHRKRFARKVLYDKRGLDKAAVAALMSETDGEMVGINEGVTLEEVLKVVQFPPLDAQVYQHSEQVESDMNNVTGVSEYMRGGEQRIRRTATEASIVDNAANSRAKAKLVLVEGVLADVGRRLVMLAQQYLTEATVGRLTGQNGGAIWFELQPEDIEGEFDFEVQAGSTEPRNEIFRQQQSIQLLQSVGPFIESGVINVPELLQHVLRDGFGIKDAAKFISVPPPMVDPQTGEPLGAPPEEMPIEGEELIPA